MITTIFKYLKTNWDKIVLILFILCYIVVLGTLSILRHNAFASNFDLSNMDHTVWNTLYGNFFSLRFHDDYVSRLSVHADFILILLSPLYLFWDDVRALLLSQTVFLAIGAVPVYLIALKVLKNKFLSLSIAFIYLINPGMMWSNIYDFHPVTLAVPFMLFSFYFAYIKKWLWYWIFIFLTLITKENQSLNISMLGLAIYFVFKNKKVGLTTFVLGVAWFVTMVFFVMPNFSINNIHWALGELESEPTKSSIITTILSRDLIYTFFIDKYSINYYRMLIEPFGFLPLFGLPWILLSLPSIFINIVRDTRTITFHYGTGIIPSLVIASIFGFSYLSLLLSKLKVSKTFAKYLLYFVAFLVVIIALRFNYFYSPLPTTPSCWCFMYDVTAEDKAFEKALKRIPENASITASLEVRPHVNHRENVWFVPSATHSAEFIALIRQNRIIGNYEPKDYENKLIPILLSSNDHKVIFKSENFYLFEKVNK